MINLDELKPLMYAKAAQTNSLDAGLLKICWIVYQRAHAEGVAEGRAEVAQWVKDFASPPPLDQVYSNSEES